MAADYAEPLKRAWEACPCRDVAHYCMAEAGRTIPPRWRCSCWQAKHNRADSDVTGPCLWPGHAALLEMVDKIHLPNCLCRRPGGGAGCHIERRRLRAAVGVSDD